MPLPVNLPSPLTARRVRLGLAVLALVAGSLAIGPHRAARAAEVNNIALGSEATASSVENAGTAGFCGCRRRSLDAMVIGIQRSAMAAARPRRDRRRSAGSRSTGRPRSQRRTTSRYRTTRRRGPRSTARHPAPAAPRTSPFPPVRAAATCDSPEPHARRSAARSTATRSSSSRCWAHSRRQRYRHRATQRACSRARRSTFQSR